MTFEAFSQEWAEAWARALNASPAYRAAAARWEGSVGLVLDDGAPAGRLAVILDLHDGRCRHAGVADPDALDAAGFVFQAGTRDWQAVFSGNVSPAMALMNGRIRLAKGGVAALIPYAGAAQQLLDIAGKVPTRFAEG